MNEKETPPPLVGWYVYSITQTDAKKSKQTLRWARVNGFWLEMSSNPKDLPNISIHLGFTNFKPSMEANGDANALELKTYSFAGEFEMKITTNNRFDILDLNQALVQGKECWKQCLENGIKQTSYESSFKDKKNSFLGGKNIECSISPEGFKTSRSATESTQYSFNQILFIRPLPFDSRHGACFEMAVNNGKAKVEMLYQCHDHAEMEKFLMIFLYHLSKQEGLQQQ
ncbi:hypothetical protein GPJ56_004121 [Histomonas meleagridis]|uniref:uncharacterized protein n=1 Tax=Histomonas meleagridis TaxID=135588 RepID=UPI0035593C57|nr:hypothetical protein GPJ56_004121 [Histomonas meleagridis]KAH0801462.1 hypothetical protein GO595_005714 [Histomonas meleagridis]